MTGYLFCSGR